LLRLAALMVERFPDFLSGLQVATAQFARAVDPVDMSVLDGRRPDQAAQALHLAEVLGLGAPEDARFRLLGVELQGERSVVEASHKENVAGQAGCCDRSRRAVRLHVAGVFLAPVLLARFRAEAV